MSPDEADAQLRKTYAQEAVALYKAVCTELREAGLDGNEIQRLGLPLTQVASSLAVAASSMASLFDGSLLMPGIGTTTPGGTE
jgi:hypothetical protein